MTAAAIIAGGEAIAANHDVTNEEKWQEVVNKAVNTYGKLDVLVVASSIYQSKMELFY